MTFIKVEIKNGNIVRLNIGSIISYCMPRGSSFTEVSLLDIECAVEVRETPEEIDKLIRVAKQ